VASKSSHPSLEAIARCVVVRVRPSGVSARAPLGDEYPESCKLRCNRFLRQACRPPDHQDRHEGRTESRKKRIKGNEAGRSWIARRLLAPGGVVKEPDPTEFPGLLAA